MMLYDPGTEIDENRREIVVRLRTKCPKVAEPCRFGDITDACCCLHNPCRNLTGKMGYLNVV